jgi:ribonuclease HII
MAVLVGIDEAGFGPILGPLVVSSCSFSLPQHLLKADLWQILKKTVSNKRKHIAGRLLITDSKKAYTRSLGIKHLERTVLAALLCLGEKPTTLNDLLALLCRDALDRLNQYPWYKDAGTLPIPADNKDKAIAAAALANDLADNDIALAGLKSCCLDVGFYNKMMDSVRNKASVLFTATSRLIKDAYDTHVQDELEIVIDRQGGRMRYREHLLRSFPDMSLTIIRETPNASSYELCADGRRMCLHFVVDADESCLSVSLASMVSKYLRELLVRNINQYFIAYNENLKPTAGYWKDGLRFLQDLKVNLPDFNINSNLLIRCR